MRRMFLFVMTLATVFTASGCCGGGEKLAQTMPTVTTFSVTVDYSRSLAEMIAAGQYTHVDPDINTANFPVFGEGTAVVNVELVQFGHLMTSNDVLIAFGKLGLRPATLPELLAFGAAYPAEQRKYPIIALGSIWHGWYGFRGVPFLWDVSVERFLGLCWFGNDWVGGLRFLAVREPST